MNRELFNQIKGFLLILVLFVIIDFSLDGSEAMIQCDRSEYVQSAGVSPQVLTSLIFRFEGDVEETDQPVVVFDFGGVMAEFDLPQMLEYCADAFGMPLTEFKQAIKKDIDRLAIGDIDEEEFWTQLAVSHRVKLPFLWKERYKSFIKELVSPRQEMYAFLNELKADGYRVALFSDVTAWQAEAFWELGLYQGFCSIVLSCNIGTRKPRLESYQILLEKLEIKPEQCVFVDDRSGNIEAAREIGISGIIYTSFEEVKSAIKEELTCFRRAGLDLVDSKS